MVPMEKSKKFSVAGVEWARKKKMENGIREKEQQEFMLRFLGYYKNLGFYSEWNGVIAEFW